MIAVSGVAVNHDRKGGSARDPPRFMIAVSGVAVNHDRKGVSAPDPLVWDGGGRRKVRRTDIRINIDLASLPTPRVSRVGFGCRFMVVALLVLPGRKSVGILCEFTSFLGTLALAVRCC